MHRIRVCPTSDSETYHIVSTNGHYELHRDRDGRCVLSGDTLHELLKDIADLDQERLH